MLRTVIDLLFPRRCLGCGAAGWPFCAGCAGAVAVLSGPGCRRCGRPLENDVPRCRDCPPPAISWSRAAFLYEGPVRRALMRLKFSGWRSAADALAPWIADAAATRPPSVERSGTRSGPETPTLTWVPLGRRRKRDRGFDQAEALARAVAERLRWPVTRLVERVHDTAPQARRTGAERRRALEGAFRVRARPPPLVILVDDVLTSGSTTAGCASALRLAGAREVGVLTAARALGGGVPARCFGIDRPGPAGPSMTAADVREADGRV